MSVAVTVRRSNRDDARAISKIRIEGWRAAYRGLVEEALLARMDIDRETERRTERWDEHHVDPRSAEFVAAVDGETVGWVVVGPSRTPDVVGAGELYAIYVLPAYWSTGIGHLLMDAAEQALLEAGFDTAHLWVLEGNERAAAFYERHGWSEDGGYKLDEDIVGDTGARPLLERRRARTLRA